MGSGGLEPFEHQVDHGDMNPRFTALRAFLIVFAQPATSAQPGQSAFHHPPSGQDLEVVAIRFALHYGEQPATGDPSSRHQPARVASVRPDQLQGVHHDMPFASRYPFASVVTLRPPFSVVFTDWLSILEQSGMAALGVASRPAASRTRARRASSTRSHVPSSRHFRKYHHTVPQGGRSWGIIRQGIPPRSTYRTPLTTSRRSVVRGWPRTVSGGNNGANSSHWASVKSLG